MVKIIAFLSKLFSSEVYPLHEVADRGKRQTLFT